MSGVAAGCTAGPGIEGHLQSVGKFLDYLDKDSHHDLDPTSSPSARTQTLVKMLYLVGLGLSDETDITVKGLEVVKKASRVYLEAYTSILLVNQTVLVSNHSSSPSAS